MPFEIVRNDITRMRVDAIVNAANNSLLGGGGVDGAIHRAAGPQLKEECRALGGCETGNAKITGAYRLPCRYVIHTVGPVWMGGGQGEEALLGACYSRSLELALENGCASVAFPLISAGAYGYPRRDALRIAREAILAFLQAHDEMLVYLVIYDRASFSISEKLYADIKTYIDDSAVPEDYFEQEKKRRLANRPWDDTLSCLESPQSEDAAPAPLRPQSASAPLKEEKKKKLSFWKHADREESPPLCAPQEAGAQAAPYEDDAAFSVPGLSDYLKRMDEGFRDMLLRKIDERGMTDAACYKKANIDRKLFNKIKNVEGYKPGKPTVLAFAIALELPLEETRELLEKAGFALTHSSRFDLIVEFFIRQGNYDIYDINEALFAFDQTLLGNGMSQA